MSMVSTDFRFLVDNDINPLILFSNDGKILYLNKSAEILVGSFPKKELYALAILYAPKSFGSKITYVDLTYKLFKFYAVNVLYKNEDEICLHLYSKALDRKNKIILDNFTKTDISTILEVNIELFRTIFKGKLTLFIDLDLPEIALNQNSFSIIMRKIFQKCEKSEEVSIEVKLKIGEYLIIDNDRYPILTIKIESQKLEQINDSEIEELCAKNHITSFITKNEVVLEIPYIKPSN